mmetsp:Transcript_46662/g.82275  ORF Transcript_46662/g.82275 Transcript_46662/m.82275 type:complete len:202 (-) Transcript_46662:118-723(-)
MKVNIASRVRMMASAKGLGTPDGELRQSSASMPMLTPWSIITIPKNTSACVRWIHGPVSPGAARCLSLTKSIRRALRDFLLGLTAGDCSVALVAGVSGSVKPASGSETLALPCGKAMLLTAHMASADAAWAAAMAALVVFCCRTRSETELCTKSFLSAADFWSSCSFTPPASSLSSCHSSDLHSSSSSCICSECSVLPWAS